MLVTTIKIYFNSWLRSYTRIRWYYTNCRKKYSINFTKSNTKFCLSLHYNRENSYLFVNGTEIHRFKSKSFDMDKGEPISRKISLGNISTGFSTDNMKKMFI